MSDQEQADDAAEAEESVDEAAVEDDEIETEVDEESEVEEAEGDDAEADDVEADDADSEADDAEDEESGLGEGDFVRLAYTIRTADDGQVIDTTDEEIAEEAEIDTDEYEFEPRIIALGAGHVFPPVDEGLRGAEVDDTGTIEIPAAEAFGEHDADEVETVKADKIPEDSRYPGGQVQIDGQQGRLETIIGGRARVDFNHPLAGEDLEYEYEVLGVIEDDEEKAAGLLAMYLQEEPEVRIEEVTEEEEVTTEYHEEDEDGEEVRETETQEVDKRVLYIEATPQMQMNQQWMFQKQQVAQDLMGRLELDRVVIEEVIDGGGMGGLGGMMGGMGGGPGGADLEEALEDVDVDADELAEELDEE